MFLLPPKVETKWSNIHIRTFVRSVMGDLLNSPYIVLGLKKVNLDLDEPQANMTPEEQKDAHEAMRTFREEDR